MPAERLTAKHLRLIEETALDLRGVHTSKYTIQTIIEALQDRERLLAHIKAIALPSEPDVLRQDNEHHVARAYAAEADAAALLGAVRALLAVTEHGSNSGPVFDARVVAYAALKGRGAVAQPETKPGSES